MESKGVISFHHFNIDQHWCNQLRRVVRFRHFYYVGNTEVTVCQYAIYASLLSPRHNREIIYRYSAPNMSPSISQPLYHIIVPPSQQQVPNVTLVFTTAWFC